MSRIHAIFFVASFGFILSMFYRVSATVISPMLSDHLGLGPVGLSNLSATFFYAFALAQLPMGIALDRIGPRKVMTTLAAVSITGALLFGLANAPWQAFLGRALLGVGTSCNMMAPLTLFMAWCRPERFASLMGIVISLGWIGALLATTPLALLTEYSSWHAAFLLVAGLNVLEFVLVVLVIKNRPDDQPAPEISPDPPLAGLKRLFLSPVFWVMSLGAFFRFGSVMALQALWAGPYLRYAIGLNNIDTGNVVFASSLGYIIGLPTMGLVSDKLLHTRKWIILPGFFLLASLILSLSWWTADTPLWFLHLIFFGIGFAATPGQLIYAQLKELVPQNMASTALTGVNFCNMLGPACMMQVGGLFLPSEIASATCACDYAPMWHFFAAGLCLAGLLYLFLPDSKPQHPARMQV